MTNSRVLHSSLKGFWGRLMYSCSLPPRLPPLPSQEIWKQQQAQHPYRLHHHFQLLRCVFCGTSPLHGVLRFSSFAYTPGQTPSTTWAPPEHHPVLLGTAWTHSTSCTPPKQPEKQMLQNLSIADTQIKQWFFFFFLIFHRDVSKDLCMHD